MVDVTVSTLLNQCMEDTLSNDPQPQLPPPSSDPLTYAAAVHKLEEWLKKESKLADEAAVRYGKKRSMNETVIGAAIGRTAAHVYKVRKRLEDAGEVMADS
ncbi:hypothetical protein GCM10027258_79730 [Amycolatopsis stemonae]